MPIAWHNPVSNQSYLISSTDCTFPAIGPNLDHVSGQHDCDASPYIAGNESTPWSYNNHQWLQSVRVFPNGTGFAFVHNEFHGEQPPHNRSYCSFDGKTSTGQCILWSTDLATTKNGGATWQLALAPVITLPRPYAKDAAIAGYGELGGVLHNHDGFYYAHVARSYHNNTGAGPVNTAARGTCVFRTADPTDPTTYRGWNGSAWATEWADPYTTPTAEPDLWQRTCADVKLHGNNQANHINPKRFAGPLTAIEGWPTHVMSGLSGDKTSYYFPSASGAAAGAAPFTAWDEAPTGIVDVQDWLDPCTIGGRRLKWMYPNLIDHSSPALGELSQGATGSESKADGLSYGLVGNSSLFLYAVLSREFIVRVPVAWFLPGQALPRGPFVPPPPPKLNPVGCTALTVAGAANMGVNGIYKASGPVQKDGTHMYTKDKDHLVYHFQGVWKLGRNGKNGVVYYTALHDVAHAGLGVPITSWGCGDDSPTATCTS
jgi:hypothetical protein